VHRLTLRSDRALRLLQSDLEGLGIDSGRYLEPNYRQTQNIGAAVSFIGCDGLIIPSARWRCENLILFTDNLALAANLEVLDTEEVDWQTWATEVGLL
jgi:hypothetical protein